MTKFSSLLDDLKKAVERLAEALAQEKTSIVRDSAIKRFELVFDLGWKALKAFLEEYHNASCASPRICFREGFRLGALDYDQFWIDITDMRNYAVHSYSEALAEKIYQRLPEALQKYQTLVRVLRQERKTE